MLAQLGRGAERRTRLLAPSGSWRRGEKCRAAKPQSAQETPGSSNCFETIILSGSISGLVGQTPTRDPEPASHPPL